MSKVFVLRNGLFVPEEERSEAKNRKPKPVVLCEGFLVCDKCGLLMKKYRDERETLVGFASPPGHDHNDNCLLRDYLCANGHERTIAKRRRCPACSWVGKGRCFCHDGPKLDEWPNGSKCKAFR